MCVCVYTYTIYFYQIYIFYKSQTSTSTYVSNISNIASPLTSRKCVHRSLIRCSYYIIRSRPMMCKWWGTVVLDIWVIGSGKAMND